MRALPNISVVCPADPVEAAALPAVLARTASPAYVRLGRGHEPKVHQRRPSMEVGRGIEVIGNDRADVAVFSTGNMLANAAAAVRRLDSEGVKARLFSMPWVKPIDERLILSEAEGCKLIVTVEEHVYTGGLRSAVVDVLCENDARTPVRSVSLPDAFQKTTGSQEFLRKQNGLDADSIGKKIRSWRG